MSEKLAGRLLYLLLGVTVILGLWAMLRFTEVNRIRGDEFLSFLHSDPAFHPSAAGVWKNIGEGADNSYIHAVLLQQWFARLGAGIVQQRLLSLLFWAIGGACLAGILALYRKPFAHVVLFWVLVQFGNMGFLLADDGRFYSLHYAGILALFLATARFLEKEKRTWLLPVIALLTFTALLTTALAAVFLLFLLLALFLVAAGRLVAFRQAALIALAVLIPLLTYFAFFRIGHFHAHFTSWLFRQATSDALPLADFAGTPFRFYLNAKLPGLPDVFGVAVTLLVLGVFYRFSRSEPGSYPAVVLLVNKLALLILVLLVLQLLAHGLFSWPLWPYRYYAGLGWVLPLWLFQRTSLFQSRIGMLMAVLIGTGACLRMGDELIKIGDRKSRIPAPVTETTVYTERFERYEAFGQMGEQYIRYPHTRSLLFLQPDTLSVERNAYFRLLVRQGDDLNLLEAGSE